MASDTATETPVTPRTSGSHALHFSPSSTVPSTNAARSPESPRSSRKRNNDEAWKASPTRTKNPSSQPTATPERLYTRQLEPPLEFNPEKATALPVKDDLNPLKLMGSDMESEQNATSRAEGAQPQQSFVEQIAQYKEDLENEYKKFEDDLQQQSRGETALQSMGWEGLEARYRKAVEPLAKEEQKVVDEFSTCFKHFLLWMQVSNSREAERAIKRLRTRIAFVKHSEDKLADKQAHYDKVLKAFQNAMALLGNL